MEPLLKVEALDMSFGGVQALSEVSFSALAGRITAVIGPNGAGKTTAINCISGVYRPQGGRVLFGGQAITGLAPHVLARQGLTRTFQNLQVFTNLTVLENVMVGLHGVTGKGFVSAMLRLPGQRAEERRIRARALEALTFLGLAARAGLPAGQLSYGDRKRVELARALVARPKLVLLDEPVAGLNPAETEEMGRVLLEVRRQGVGLLLVEHDMSLVMRVSDQVVVLHFGRQIAQGDPQAIQRHPEVLRTYLGCQDQPPPGVEPAIALEAAHA
ncbi:MAG: ABC transporter ATP-binding protein [Desulfarculus sp.]|nr:ABC transporter ATP-binding protein [Desulfarculus sp.]